MVLRSWDLDTELEFVMRNQWFFEVELNEEFEKFEKDFRNSLYSAGGGWDSRRGHSFRLSYGFGENYDSDLRLLEGRTTLKIKDGWDLSYSLTRLWLDPDPELDTTWIHVLRTD